MLIAVLPMLNFHISLISQQLITQRMTKAFLFITLLIFSCSFFLDAQPITNKVYKHQIKTVQCHKKGWPLTYPILNLNLDEQIELSFDELNADTKDYYYCIILCDRNWEPSVLMETEYLQGINEIPLLDYQYSFNTTIDYVHYTINIPNNDIEILLSGNYIIKVYEDFDKSKPVLTQRFMVSEQRISILPDVKFTMNSELRKAKQEVDFEVQHPGIQFQNPIEEITAEIYQNGRLDNAILNLKPQFIKNNLLEYNYNRETMFEGGNEFRWLDTRSLRFKSSKIKDISFHDPYSHVELFPDPIYAGQSYFFNNDFNGRYVIEVQEERDPEIEAEYVFVHFTLPMDVPVVGGNVFVLGALTNWQFSEEAKMTYSFERKQYELSLLLKQGFYNYHFAFKPSNSREATVSLFEGSHSKTENDYLILIYYRSMGQDYDRLIGYRQINSVTAYQ